MVARLFNFFQRIKKMKIKHLGIITISTLTLLTLSSCATILHGTSTKVMIETDNGNVDNVNLTAIGPKKVVELKNISLPYRMKVKHNNLPLRITLNSDNDAYDPFTIGAIHKGEVIGGLSKLSGYITMGSALVGASALEFGGGGGFSDSETITAMAPFVGVCAALLAIGYTAETDIPDNKFYLTSSYPITSNNVYEREEWYRRLTAINDVYGLLKDKEYKLAEAKSRWLLDQEPTGELFYLKGISNYYLGKYKQSLEDLKNGLFLVDAEINPGLRESIIECIETTENAKQMKAEERNQRWANIAGGILQAGATIYQGYAQMKQYEEWQKSGISPSGIVTDPSKLSQSQLNQLANPMYVVQAVQQQDWLEYMEFCRYNKKADGRNYSHDEWWALKGQAIMNLKEQGYDIITEQQEQLRQNRKEMEEDRKQYKKRWFKRYGYDISNNSTETSSTKSSTSTTSTSNKSSVSTTAKPVSSTNNTTDENLDAKQQNHRDPVASADYQKIKTVTLYYRDGNKAKVKMNNVDLCRKGAYFYIKIGNTYYPRRSPNWIRFRNAIAYGHEQLYYND